jgi:hypothetical protein
MKGELFLTSSSVEVFRLLRTRWGEVPHQGQEFIIERIIQGPPRHWFREDADVDRAIDRCRYDLLAELEKQKFALSERATAVSDEIRRRYPVWQPKPSEQAGFRIWHESGSRRIEGEAGKFDGISDDRLVEVAKAVAASASFLDGDNWQALCLAEPDRAFRGLREAAKSDDWTVAFWQQLLWARRDYVSPETEQGIAVLLLAWPSESFAAIGPAAASWLDEHTKSLDDELLWRLWDRVAAVCLVQQDVSTESSA